MMHISQFLCVLACNKFKVCSAVCLYSICVLPNECLGCNYLKCEWEQHTLCFLCWNACLDWELLLPYAGCHGGRWLIGDTHLPSLSVILQMLPCDCYVLLLVCFLRVPTLEDVESHWLHLSTLSDWGQPAATIQWSNCYPLCDWGTKASFKGRQQATSWCQYLSYADLLPPLSSDNAR